MTLPQPAPRPARPAPHPPPGSCVAWVPKVATFERHDLGAQPEVDRASPSGGADREVPAYRTGGTRPTRYSYTRMDPVRFTFVRTRSLRTPRSGSVAVPAPWPVRSVWVDVDRCRWRSEDAPGPGGRHDCGGRLYACTRGIRLGSVVPGRDMRSKLDRMKRSWSSLTAFACGSATARHRDTRCERSRRRSPLLLEWMCLRAPNKLDHIPVDDDVVNLSVVRQVTF